MRGLTIDPGLSTGACLFEYGPDQPFTPIETWQFPFGADGIRMWMDHFGLKLARGRGTKEVMWFQNKPLDALVVEKFTPWNDPEQEFKLTSDAVEPLRGEGVLIGRGFGNLIQWGQPSQQYFIGSPTLPKVEKRKLAKAFLKENGFYLTGSMVSNQDAEDAISATLHSIAWLRRMRHMPTMTALFKKEF